MPESYSINSQIYYNSIEQCYRKIVVIDRKPQGPLQNIVRTLHTPKLSPFQESSPCCPINRCIQAIYDPNDPSRLLSLESLPLLVTFLQTNGYTIDSGLTTLMKPSNELIFYISY